MNRKKLLQDIQAVKPAVGTNGIITFMNNGLIVGVGTEFSIYKKSDSACFNGSVEIKRIEELLKKIGDDDISLNAEENSINLTWGGNTAQVNLLDLPLPNVPDEVFDPPNNDTMHHFENPDTLSKISNAVFCTVNDVSKPALAGVHLTGSLVEACDNKRIIQYGLDDTLQFDVILPVKSASVISKLFASMAYPSKERNTLFLYDEENDVIVESRLYGMGGDYPDLAKVPNSDGYPEHCAFVAPEGFMDAVQRAQLVSHNYDSIDYVKVENYGKYVTVSTDSNTGNYYECLTVDENLREREEGTQPEFYIQPHFLADVVKDGDTIHIGSQTLYIQRESEVLTYIPSLCQVTEE